MCFLGYDNMIFYIMEKRAIVVTVVMANNNPIIIINILFVITYTYTILKKQLVKSNPILPLNLRTYHLTHCLSLVYSRPIQ